METKYKIGDEVSIEYIGVITAMELRDNELYFTISKENIVGKPRTISYFVKENNIFSLPMPEDFNAK